MKRIQSLVLTTPFALLLSVAMGLSLTHAAPAKAPAKAPAAAKAPAKVKPVVKAVAMKYKVAKGTVLQVDVYHTAKHVIAKSKKVKGLVTMTNGSKIALSGALSVRIKGLKSGNRRRNRVMWSSLGKSRQPYIYFYPSSMTLKGKTGTIEGTFQIRKKKKKVTMTISNFEGKIDGKGPISLTAAGKLKCTDFGVKRPSLLFVKIKDVVDVKISLKLAPKK